MSRNFRIRLALSVAVVPQPTVKLENLIEVKICFSHRGRKARQTRDRDIRSFFVGVTVSSIISSISSCESWRIGGVSKHPCDEVAIKMRSACMQDGWTDQINA